MASKALSLSNPELVAEYVSQSEFKGFFEKRLAAPPDHMAMLIRNGEIVDTYKGAHFSVNGIFKSLKSLVVGSSHISILLADLKPFSLQTGFQAISKDNVPIRANATFELQVNPDQPKNVMGLVNTSGYLTQDEILTRFKPHLTDRVIEAAVRKVNAADIRGERGLQDHIQAEIMREIKRVAGDLGLIVRATSLEWAISDVERAAMEKSVLDREQVKLDNELDYLRRNISREKESTIFRLEADFDLAKITNAKEEELEKLILDREFRIVDARAEGQRRQEFAELSHQLELLKTKRFARFESQLAESDHLVDIATRKTNLMRVELEMDRLQRMHEVELLRIEQQTQIDLNKQSQLSDLEISDQANQNQYEHLRRLQNLEQDAENAEAARRNTSIQLSAQLEMEKTRTEAEARVAQLQAGANMTPEQALAINAGLSPEVANVLVEQARASANSNEQVMSMMREMVDQANKNQTASADQARDMFQMGMQGATGVAQGVGGARQTGPGIGNNSDSEAQNVECSKCGRENASKNRFCVGCGTQLRK